MTNKEKEHLRELIQGKSQAEARVRRAYDAVNKAQEELQTALNDEKVITNALTDALAFTDDSPAHE